MNKLIWNLIKFAPAVLAAGFAMTGASAVKAESTQEMLDQIQQYSTTGQAANTMGQVNSISQLRDVAPGDWAFSALRNLVERYDCLDGYPNRTFQGNRALTRYEFAAGLNACMEQMERLITTGSTNVTPPDLGQINRLLDEFEAELATLGTRVDNLEGRLGEVEDNQFSTTTKLKGEAIFTIASPFDNPTGSENTTFSQRTRLNFDSSFTGKDNLHLRLEQGNFGRFGATTPPTYGGSNSARLGADENTDGNVEVTDLWYSFPVGDAITMHLGASKTEFEDVVSDLYNPYMESSGSGSLTRFLRRNPAVYRMGGENQTVAANIDLSDNFGVDLAYTVENGNNPADGNGLFDGDYAALAQLNWKPSDKVGLGLTYVRSYEQDGSVNLSGSTVSADGTINPSSPLGGGTGVNADRFGVQANLGITDGINLAGWFGIVDAQATTGTADAQVTNWATNLSFPNFGKDGAVLNFGFGQPPKITGGSVAQNTDTSYIAEINYKYPVNKNISITPGVYAVFNPDHNNNNDTIVVGAVRTTFKF
jgi:hypothetical protein